MCLSGTLHGSLVPSKLTVMVVSRLRMASLSAGFPLGSTSHGHWPAQYFQFVTQPDLRQVSAVQQLHLSPTPSQSLMLPQQTPSFVHVLT